MQTVERVLTPELTHSAVRVRMDMQGLHARPVSSDFKLFQFQLYHYEGGFITFKLLHKICLWIACSQKEYVTSR